MSLITDATITVHNSSLGIGELLCMPINSWDSRVQYFRPINTDEAGGTKTLTSGVYAAAFNYLRGEHIAAWFNSLPWGTADSAVLTISEEDGSGLTIVKAEGKTVTVETFIVDLRMGDRAVRVTSP